MNQRLPLAGLLVLAAALALRLVPGQDAGRRAAALPVGSVSHVLWVDDNPENNAEVMKQFESRGIQVTAAMSTADAVQRYDPAVPRAIVEDCSEVLRVMGFWRRSDIFPGTPP